MNALVQVHSVLTGDNILGCRPLLRLVLGPIRSKGRREHKTRVDKTLSFLSPSEDPTEPDTLHLTTTATHNVHCDFVLKTQRQVCKRPVSPGSSERVRVCATERPKALTSAWANHYGTVKYCY